MDTVKGGNLLLGVIRGKILSKLMKLFFIGKVSVRPFPVRCEPDAPQFFQADIPESEIPTNKFKLILNLWTKCHYQIFNQWISPDYVNVINEAENSRCKNQIQ